MKTDKIVHLGGRLHRSYEEISFLKADINYTEIHFKNGESLLVATTLGKLQKRLPQNMFYRINRSKVLNLHLRGLRIEDDQIGLNKQPPFRISRRRKQGLMDRISRSLMAES